MRTTLDLDDELHARLKALAARAGRPLTRVLEDAIRGFLDDVESQPGTAPPTFPSFAGGTAPGLMPGVDLDDTAALTDLMDADDAGAAA